MMQPIDVVKAFLDDIADVSQEPAAVFRKWLTADCLWEQSGVPDQHGVEESVQFLENGRRQLAFHTWSVEHVGICATGDLVFNERTDHLIDAAGRKIGISIPVMSAFRVRGEQISEWRDYFNPGDVRPTAAA